MAEACGGRTHQPVISGFAGFEDQEGHRAHSASALFEDSGGSKMMSSYFRRLSRDPELPGSRRTMNFDADRN